MPAAGPASSTLALQIAGMSLLSERTWRTWEMLRATPATAADLLIGKAAPVLQCCCCSRPW